jgi:hypothetical protein
MNLWELCESDQFITSLSVEPWRVVEAQHILSARDLVDTREEHDMLETLLEDSKPAVTKDKNYLIFTPFRYPPLQYGSRFGRSYEPSLWYGSLELETAFTEVAYYRFKFLNDSSGELGPLEISMTAFTACLQTERALDLTAFPFNDYLAQISNQHTYEYSQPLGTSMRQAKIDAFIYFSARTHTKEKNVAAYHTGLFRIKNSQYVNNQQTWVCFANKDVIEFTRVGLLGKERFSFSTRYFKEIG